jgi:hypothetical protein
MAALWAKNPNNTARKILVFIVSYPWEQAGLAHIPLVVERPIGCLAAATSYLAGDLPRFGRVPPIAHAAGFSNRIG